MLPLDNENGGLPQILRDNQVPISTLNFLLRITCLYVCREHELSNTQ